MTGNTDNSVLTGGDDWSFTDNSQSIETNELDSGSQTQFYDLFAKSWLGSLMENIENYEEIGMSEGDSTSFDNQQSFKSFMQQYQLTDV